METERLLLTPEEAAACIGIGRTRIFELIRTGHIDSVRIGRSRRVSREALVEYISRLPRSGSPAA